MTVRTICRRLSHECVCVRARARSERSEKKKQRTRVFAQRKKYKKCENSDWESNSENEIAQNGAVELIQWNGDDDEQIFFHTKIVPFVSRSRRVDANKWGLGCVIKFQHIFLFFRTFVHKWIPFKMTEGTMKLRSR